MRTYDGMAVAKLDKRYSTPQVIDQRRRVREIIGARNGEVGLDLGCGPGFLACELAAEVAPAGQIVAIDTSSNSVDVTAARAARGGHTGIVKVQLGDAANLDFPDDIFDFVTSMQVYCYVPDVGRAIREAARVLRKGGRLVVLDSDWDFCTWRSRDASLTRRMLAARGARQFAHAHLPRELHGLFLGAGLTLAGAQVFSMIETRYDPDSFGAENIQSTCEAAVEHGVPAADVAAWEWDLRARHSDGEWFFWLNRFIFTGTK